MDNRESCLRFNLVLFAVLPLVRFYRDQASGHVLQYKCTYRMYSNIAVPSKVCALVMKKYKFTQTG
jgi:hypothetical protein